MAVQEALKEGPFSLHRLAEKAGLRYETVRMWAVGQRNPRPENIKRLLDAMDEQADEIKELVRQARESG